MLDTGASCSIINYGTFWEVSQFYYSVMVHRSNKLTKTYSSQVVPMIDYATIEFSYDPNGEYSFPLTVWITEMRTQNLFGMDFCQNQASGFHFDLPGIELRQPPKTFCYGSLHQNKTLPYVSQSLTVRLPYTIYVDAKSARCWKYSPGDPKSLFLPGSTFQPNREAVSTGLIFVKNICTQPERTLPILIEINKIHQITLPMGRIGFSSLDVADKEEPKYQIRNPYELTNSIKTTDDKYNDCFLLHSTFPAQSPDDCLQIIQGTEHSKLQQPHSKGHCISAKDKMSKEFADLLSQRIPRLRDTCRRTKLLSGQTFPFWDRVGNGYIQNLVTRTKYSEKSNLPTLSLTLEETKSHARLYAIPTIGIPKLGCGLDQMNWQEVVKLLEDIFAYSNIRIVVYTVEENGVHVLSSEGEPNFNAEDENESNSEEFHLNDKDLETDFTRDAKSCQPTCDEQLPTFREKEKYNHLIEHNLQYQPQELVQYVKEFDFQFSDIIDEEMTFLIEMLIDSRNV